jgi:hypothetical protein
VTNLERIGAVPRALPARGSGRWRSPQDPFLSVDDPVLEPVCGLLAYQALDRFAEVLVVTSGNRWRVGAAS